MGGGEGWSHWQRNGHPCMVISVFYLVLCAIVAGVGNTAPSLAHLFGIWGQGLIHSPRPINDCAESPTPRNIYLICLILSFLSLPAIHLWHQGPSWPCIFVIYIFHNNKIWSYLFLKSHYWPLIDSVGLKVAKISTVRTNTRSCKISCQAPGKADVWRKKLEKNLWRLSF
jgi:hypothetical protein